MKYPQSIALVASLLFFVGCANIEHSSNISQPLSQTMRAGVGDLMVRIDHERNLENAFGKSDIFGRKTKEGYSELRYAGMEANGDLIFYRTDMSIITNETTMSRMFVQDTYTSSNTTASGHYGAGYVSGHAKTTSHSTTIGPTEDYHIVVPQSAIPIRLKGNQREIVMGTYLITILSAEPGYIEYTISE